VPPESSIAIVDDDESVREAIRNLLRSAGYHADVYASAEEFLASAQIASTSCLILDVRMPGMTGLELQTHLLSSHRPIAAVFITAHADDKAKARALHAGAVAFLRKPFSDRALLDAIALAVGA